MSIVYLYLTEYSGRERNNKSAFYLYWKEYSDRKVDYTCVYKYNTLLLLQYTYIAVGFVLYSFSCQNIPAGNFRQIHIKYTFIDALCVLYSFSGRYIPYCIFYVFYTLRNSGRNSGRNGILAGIQIHYRCNLTDVVLLCVCRR